MQLHQLTPKYKTKKRKRVGRGGKRGTYSGKGQKGQKSRSGRKLQPVVREIIKRYPKLKGYKRKIFRKEISSINVGTLEKAFESSQEVSPAILIEKGLIQKTKGKIPRVKILGNGKLTKSLLVKNCLVSKSAKEAIEKAGGKIV